MHIGLGRTTVTADGQLSFDRPHADAGLVAANEPMVWAATDKGERAVTARSQDAITGRDDLQPCGTTVTDDAFQVPVPEDVFETVNGVAPGAAVALVASQEMLDADMVYVVAMDHVFDEFPEIDGVWP